MTDEKKTKEILAKRLKIKDKEVLDETYTAYKKLTEKKPYPTLKGIDFQIEDVARRNAKAKGAKPEDSSISRSSRNSIRAVSSTHFIRDKRNGLSDLVGMCGCSGCSSIDFVDDGLESQADADGIVYAELQNNPRLSICGGKKFDRQRTGSENIFNPCSVTRHARF